MFDTYLIEIQDHSAGILVRDGSQYYFCAVGENFALLEGRRFTTPHAAEKAAAHLMTNRSPKMGERDKREA